MTAVLIAEFHATVLNVVEMVAGLTVCATLLLLAVAPKRH